MVTIRRPFANIMRIPSLDGRAAPQERRSEKSNQKSFIMISIIAVAVLAILVITYLLTMKFRKKDGKAKKNKAEKLPSLFSWNWRKRSSRGQYSTTLQENELDRNSSRQDSVAREMTNQDPERQDAGVDRHTSVRSVMTLPAYSPAARENERILGREGERGGVDTVVEFPETVDDEEARREGEMESLYQIRLARRNEAREREERRQARREARQRGDMQALTEIRRRAEAAAEESVSQLLIATHQGANRERRVSSVQYGDLGVARHDGTRLRANSSESDNRPLLDSAASISGQSGRSRALSSNTLTTSHHRGVSASSVLSVSSRGSDDFEFPEAAHRASNDNSDDFEVVSLSHPRSRSASRVATPNPGPSIEIPREQAPAYEDPPNYESPVQTRAPTLPMLERLPSIQVTPEPAPADGRSMSPR